MSNQSIEIVGNQPFAAMWADIAARATIQEPPPGAMSIRQFAEKFTDGRIDAASNALRSEERAGRLRSELFRVVSGGQIRSVRYFMPVAPSAKKPARTRL